MLTRGRQANHVYLQVVGDGDPHTLVHTDAADLLTGVERLERMLAHDDTIESASTQLREQNDPARLLAPAVARYTDALGVAAEQIVGADAAGRLDEAADQLVLWLTECPAWDTLRADLLGHAAGGRDPVALLRRAVEMGELETAHDAAAVLDHRLHLLVPNEAAGPLPWLRNIPAGVADDATWGPYLRARAARVEGLADAVRTQALDSDLPPSWLGEMATSPHSIVETDVVGDIAVWRAAADVPVTDSRPTGEPAVADAAMRWQQELDARFDRAMGSHAGVWGQRLARIDPAIARDPERLVVARRLHELEVDGISLVPVVREALAQGQLPADHAASALWWRVAGLAQVWQGWPSNSTNEVWETVTPQPVRRPDHERKTGCGHDRDRSGPSIGF